VACSNNIVENKIVMNLGISQKSREIWNEVQQRDKWRIFSNNHSKVVGKEIGLANLKIKDNREGEGIEHHDQNQVG